jgi:hypothetical protein
VRPDMHRFHGVRQEARALEYEAETTVAAVKEEAAGERRVRGRWH